MNENDIDIPLDNEANAASESDAKKKRAERLFTLRRMAGVNRPELATISAISVNTLTSWELARAGGLTLKGAQRVVDALKKCNVVCTTLWLLEGLGDKPYVADRGEISVRTPSTDESILLPEQEKIFQEINYFCSINKNAIMLRVLDDSMLPHVRSGDILGGVLVPEHYNPLENELYLLRINQKLICRKLFRGDKRGTFTFKCTNEQASSTDLFIYNIIPEELAKVVWHRTLSDFD